MTLIEQIFDLIPEGQRGDWAIVKEGPSIQLRKDGEVWMDNTIFEIGTHAEFEQAAQGDVLIGGLGLGYDILLSLQKESVTSVDCCEVAQPVIDLVWPYINPNDSRAAVIHQNVSHYLQQTNKLYDVVFFDIYPANPEFYPIETLRLTTEATAKLKPGGKVLFWRSREKFNLDQEPY